MGVDTLIKQLRQRKDEQIKQLWHEAEKKAAAIREEAAESSNALLHEKDAELTTVAENEELPLLKKAAQRSHQTILASQERLLQRTYALARKSLILLRDNQYAHQFKKLVDEIPKLPWQEVAVHPDDSVLAEHCFPGVQLRPDRTISGGFLLSMENGSIEIDNTFEKRLEKIWQPITPSLLKEINQQFNSAV